MANVEAFCHGDAELRHVAVAFQNRIREWHLNGKLIYADDWGRGAGQDYYDEARARGLSVDLEP